MAYNMAVNWAFNINILSEGKYSKFQRQVGRTLNESPVIYWWLLNRKSYFLK
jgi:hypothetical protein